jgi:hypothetical protein
MKNVVIWDVAPCASCYSRCFGRTSRLLFQGKKNPVTKNVVSSWLVVEFTASQGLLWLRENRGRASSAFGSGYQWSGEEKTD